MSTSVIPWASISLLHNTIKTLNFLHERENMPLPTVSYRAKVKLHGTNSAIQRTVDGVFAQSRTALLKDGLDNKGFGSWVRDNHSTFLSLLPGTTVFGEWCGPGVQKRVAVSSLESKIFAVFAVQIGSGESAILETEPGKIAGLLPPHVDVYVLPWFQKALELNYAEELTDSIDLLNEMVEAVEKEDPWVKDTFGISGVGEGLVFYPWLSKNLTSEEFSLLGFKAKGEKHRTVASKKAVQPSPEIATSVTSFAHLVVTQGGLEQGVSEACAGEYNVRQMKALLQWIEKDVRKECQHELDAAGLTWKQVTKAIMDVARQWYLSQQSK